MSELLRALLVSLVSASAPPAAAVVQRTPLHAEPAMPVARAGDTGHDASLAAALRGSRDDRLLPGLPAADAWLGSDKFRHFWMSYAVTAAGFAAARAAGQDSDAALAGGITVSAAAGIGKELFDRRHYGLFSVRDLLVDALGISAAYFLLREVR